MMAEVGKACRLQDHLWQVASQRNVERSWMWAAQTANRRARIRRDEGRNLPRHLPTPAPELTGMDTSPAIDAFGRWRAAMLGALATPERVLAWQDRRYRFAHQVGQLLTSPARPDAAPVTGHVVYGVYVAGAGLLYIGQTGDAKRRLRDLPVGESHHLATTVPPETWERVIVVQWPSLLPGVRDREGLAAEQLGHQMCGLALEHLLQVTYRPVMSARRRSGTGEWATRRIEVSRSRGAVNSDRFPGLFEAVRAVWDKLAGAAGPEAGDPAIYADAGRVIFPALML
jgi:hypothetical protein